MRLSDRAMAEQQADSELGRILGRRTVDRSDSPQATGHAHRLRPAPGPSCPVLPCFSFEPLREGAAAQAPASAFSPTCALADGSEVVTAHCASSRTR